MKYNTIRAIFLYLHLTNIVRLLVVRTTSKYLRFTFIVGKIFKIFRKFILYFELLLRDTSDHDIELINRKSILFFDFTSIIFSYRRRRWISCCIVFIFLSTCKLQCYLVLMCINMKLIIRHCFQPILIHVRCQSNFNRSFFVSTF